MTTNDTREWLQAKVKGKTGQLDMDVNMNSRIDIWERHDARLLRICTLLHSIRQEVALIIMIIERTTPR